MWFFYSTRVVFKRTRYSMMFENQCINACRCRNVEMKVCHEQIRMDHRAAYKVSQGDWLTIRTWDVYNYMRRMR
jgi:hypothetical protein